MRDVTLHIYRPPVTRIDHFTAWCPECLQVARFEVWFYEWQPAIETCMKCGAEWCEDEEMPGNGSYECRQQAKRYLQGEERT
jgi:hypothetical protein